MRVTRYKIIRVEWINSKFETKDLHFILKEEKRFLFFRWWSTVTEPHYGHGEPKKRAIKFRTATDASEWIDRKHRNQYRPSQWRTQTLEIKEIEHV